MRRRYWRRTAVVAAFLTIIDFAVAWPAAAGPHGSPKPQAQKSVPGHGLKALARPVDPASSHPFKAPAHIDWPAAGTATVAVSGTKSAKAGGLPVSAAAASGATRRAAGVQPLAGAAPAQVKVQVMDQAAAAKAGVTGVLMRVSRADGVAAAGPVGVQVDYSAFRYAVGGDWASRLNLVQLPECALTNPSCPGRTVLPTHNDVKTGTATADVPATAAGTVVALEASPSGGGGDYKASALSASSSWQVSTQTGDFTWSYPMEMPDAASDGAPDVTLGYTSGGTDGRTSATNNQVSWVGEGFDYWPGYVERRFVSCTDDGVTPKNGDNCWRDDNASLMLNGHATELVKDATTGAWHPKNDDGSKVEHLTGATNGDNDGEHWRVTTADGTQYYFGLNHLPGWTSGKQTTNSTWTEPVYGNNSGEPCNASPGWCQQAWRWNLDYVVDPHGNAQSDWYTAETNYYARHQTSSSSGTSTVYTRGGYLNEIDYGQRSDTLFSTTAPNRVLFTTSERCVPDTSFTCAASGFTKANASHWPDVPFDANCDSGKTCTYGAPTFWSRRRLTTITSQLWENSAWQSVDEWTLSQSFPATGDGTDPEMWLDKISSKGKRKGEATMPAVTIAGVQRTGRVDQTEGLPPLTKWRISSVTDETGRQTSVQYTDPQCVAGQTPAVDANSSLCFPAYWTPEGAVNPQLDWFHKYVTTQVTQVDGTGGAPLDVTSYAYLDAPAWHHDDDLLTPAKYKTWGQWKGFGRVRMTHGDASTPVKSQTDYLYFRGMDGDSTVAGTPKKVNITDSQGTAQPDADAFQGVTREEINYNGGTITEDVLDDVAATTTGTQNRLGVTVNSQFVRNVRTRTTSTLSTGGTRATETDTSYDSYGMETQVDLRGDTATTADDNCTRYTYARNTAANILDALARTETVKVACGTTPSRPDDVIGDVRTSFDGQAYGVAPTKGDVTRTERLASYSGSTPVYQTVSTAGYDAAGRPTTSADAENHTTKTDYTPALGGLLTKTVVTDPVGATQTTTLDPAWNLPLTVTDANQKTTTLGYDALGRLTGVWLPGRATSQTANSLYSYTIRSDGPTAVGASELAPDGSYTTRYELYDSELRPRQTQEMAPGGGRVISDTIYDSRGNEVKFNDRYHADGDPSADLFLPNSDADVPSQTITSYDGMERTAAEVFRVHGQDRWKTTYAYLGSDRVDITPPLGGTPTSTITDADGNVVERRQYHGSTPTGAYDSTRYTYGPTGKLATVTEPSGALRSYEYDLMGRQVKATDPDTGTSVFTYDDLDRRATSTDARGNTLAYAYDAVDRKTEEHQNSLTGPLLAQWTYDTLAKGYPTSSTRWINGQAYRDDVTGYDDQYNETGHTITIPAGNGFVDSQTYAYAQDFNLDGTVHRATYPAAGGLSDETLLYGYDSLGNATTLHGAIEYVSGTSYTALGQVKTQTMPANGHQWTRTNYYEDGTNRLNRVLDTRDVAPYTLTDRAYSYDDAGNVTKVSDKPEGLTADTQCYQYDYLQRLTQAWTANDDCASATPNTNLIGGPAPYWQSFTYNADGDRTSETDHATTSTAPTVTHAYTYPTAGAAQPHTVRSVTTSGGPDNGKVDTYDYDATGDTKTRNLTAGGNPQSQALSWDSEGHLASATVNGKTENYLYDADGNLLIRQSPDGSTLYLPDQEVHSTANGTLTGTRYYEIGEQTVATRTNTGLSWLLQDPQGTSTVAVDTTTQAVTRRYYTPFGQIRGGTPGADTTFPGDRTFVGGTRGAVTGLEHMGAREYDATLGRFASADPLTVFDDPQQLENYAYADNDPTNKSDPSGLWWGSGLWNKVKRAAQAAAQAAYRKWLAWKAWVAWKWRQAQAAARRLAARISHAWHRAVNKAKNVLHRTGQLLRSGLRHLKSWGGHLIKGIVRGGKGVLRSLKRHFDPGRKRQPETRKKPAPSPSPSGSEGGDGPYRPVAPENIYVGGNTLGPKPAWREGKEYKLDADGNVIPGGGEIPPLGLSTFSSLEQARRWSSGKKFWMIPKGTPLPEGFAVIHDGPSLGDPDKSTHHTFYTTRSMKPEDVLSRFKGLPWQQVN